MKKRKIIIAILVVIAITAFIVGAISGQKQATSEKHLYTVISSFLARDYVWDVSKEKISYPEYIEVSYGDNFEDFLVMVPLYSDGYRMYYFTKDGKPDFFVETPYSIEDATHSEFADIFSICKRLSYGTCFLKTSMEETVHIETVRIYRGGIIEAQDDTGTWHENVSCNSFILA